MYSLREYLWRPQDRTAVHWRSLSQGTLLQGGVQKSKFENAVFGKKPSYLMLTIMFEPKKVDTSTSRPQKLMMSKRGFHLDF